MCLERSRYACRIVRALKGVILAQGVVLLAGDSVSAAVTMTVSIRKVSDNTVDTQINWPSVALPAGWVLAANYIRLDSTLTSLNDGIQIYTDNTAADANPRYTGVISSITQTPAGLVNVAAATQKLPTAWRIKNTLGAPSPVNPGANAGESFLWLYHADRSQVANNQGAANFVNGDSYITVEKRDCPGATNTAPCIHYAQGPLEFGAESSPNVIFLEADFSTAVTPATYKTSTLRVEAFSQ